MGTINVTRVQAGLMGNNTYFLYIDGHDDCVVIDAAGDGTEICDALTTLGKTPQMLLLTHGHFDHIGGAKMLKDRYKMPIAIHEADAIKLVDANENLSVFVGTKPVTAPAADVFLSDGEILDVAGMRIEVMHTPGHSPGSVCFRCEDILVTGDTLFCRGYGRTDFPGGSTEALKQSLQRLFELPGDYTVLPGHNDRTTLDAERKANGHAASEMNAQTRERK